MTASPLQRYQTLLDSGTFYADPAQAKAVQALDDRYHQIINAKSISGWKFWRQPERIPGLYLWGSVGRGKTWLMDLFYECLPDDVPKRRVHFHRLMGEVHERLRELGKGQDPLPKLADEIADHAHVLCFDEFFVSDIGDAMLLGGMLERLFERRVLLVTTSNVEPDGLYKDGLQRARFLPSIDLLKKYCQVHELAAEQDYRLRQLEQAELYQWPLNDEACLALKDIFEEVAPGQWHHGKPLKINGRELKPLRIANSVVWFDFDMLCRQARSVADYIVLARRFTTIIIEALPAMNDDDNDACRRFVNLVDTFYDRQVKLVLSAEVTMQDLYSGNKLSFEFQRTLSRLQEMQSKEYLAKPHLP